MARGWRDLRKSTDAAVAPTVALSLFALIACGGIAFDYARLASLDTELQQAADQAALAGATQLDGETGAVERATAAAQALLTNQTLFANDAITTRSVTIPTVMFYTTRADAEANTNGFTDVARFAEANFVRVVVGTRQARYALTPVVGAIASGNLSAEAVAGVSSAICKTPPVMMCNPAEPAGNTNTEYPFAPTVGTGLRLIIGSATAPGNFGFLQTGYGTGAQALAQALGYNTPPGECMATNGVSTEPGDKEAVRAAFNTRFDMTEAGQECPGTGTCSPSRNSRKDLVKGNNCSSSGNQGWSEAANPYRAPSAITPLPTDGTADPDIMGYPRDLCHAISVDGSCTTDPAGIIGTGTWDRDAYFRVNYGWDNTQWRSSTGLPASATRYEIYKWEMDNPTVSEMAQTDSGGKVGYSYPVCRPPGVTPSTSVPDRRRISVAVVNCIAQGLAGRENNVQVEKWLEVFLIEPAFARGNGPTARTGNGDIYVEVVAETQSGGAGSTAGQVIRRDVPFLVK